MLPLTSSVQPRLPDFLAPVTSLVLLVEDSPAPVSSLELLVPEEVLVLANSPMPLVEEEALALVNSLVPLVLEDSPTLVSSLVPQDSPILAPLLDLTLSQVRQVPVPLSQALLSL